MLREIITVENENYNLKIPKEYLDKKIEILVLPFEQENTLDDDNLEKLWFDEAINRQQDLDNKNTKLINGNAVLSQAKAIIK
jgi:hypothetical protein